MPSADQIPSRCRIEAELGRDERCPGAECVFWEPGEGSRPGSCSFAQLDLAGRSELAGWLHDLRQELGGLTEVSAAEARRRFYERLNAGRSD